MSDNYSPAGDTSSQRPPKQVFSVVEAAQVLGVEKTTVYRLIYQKKLRICAGLARYSIPQTEIERLLAQTQTYDERVRSRPKAVRPRCTAKALVLNPVVHPSLNPHMLFVPSALFGDRPVGSRLVKAIVSDDESLPPQVFIEVADDEWTSISADALWPWDRQILPDTNPALPTRQHPPVLAL